MNSVKGHELLLISPVVNQSSISVWREESVNESGKINLMLNYRGDCILDEGLYFLADKYVFFLFVLYFLACLFLGKAKHCYNFVYFRKTNFWWEDSTKFRLAMTRASVSPAPVKVMAL